MEADGISVGACVEVGGDGVCVSEYTDEAGSLASVEGELYLTFSNSYSPRI